MQDVIPITAGVMIGAYFSPVFYDRILPLFRAIRQSEVPLISIKIREGMDLGELIHEMTTWLAPEPSKSPHLKKIEENLPEDVRGLLYRHLTDVSVGKRQRIAEFYEEPIVRQYLQRV